MNVVVYKTFVAFTEHKSGSSSVRLSSVTFVHPTKSQAIEIFGNVSTPFGTLDWDSCDPSVKILRRSSQGNPYVGGGELIQRGVEKCRYVTIND